MKTIANNLLKNLINDAKYSEATILYIVRLRKATNEEAVLNPSQAEELIRHLNEADQLFEAKKGNCVESHFTLAAWLNSCDSK